MKEEILHYWWQRSVHKDTTFTAIDGRHISVINPGVLNANQGPDFWNAEIEVEGLRLYGNIEMHLRTSEWYNHKHHLDPLYDTVILHVVGTSNGTVKIQGEPLIEVAVGELFDQVTLEEVNEYLEKSEQLPCRPNWEAIHPLERTLFLEQKFLQRMAQKTADILLMYDAYKGEWSRVLHEMLFTYMGRKINKEPFLRLHQLLPLSVIHKTLRSGDSLETRMLQLAGFLPMDKEGAHFLNKYQIEPLPKEIWFRHRMYPNSKPENRVVQLAKIITELYPLEAEWLLPSPTTNGTQVLKGFLVKRFDFLPKTFQQYLQINTYLPLVYAKASITQEDQVMHKVIAAFENLPIEKNVVTQKFDEFLPEKKSAIDSQALIYLYQRQCKTKKCLSCKLSNIDVINEIISKNTAVLRT